MRFQFTESERRAVVALKKACDTEGIAYTSLFELAKYVLVSHSAADDSTPDAAEIRLDSALKRIRKRNDWLIKRGLENLNFHEALIEMDKQCPGYFVNRYTKDREGRVVVAHLHACAPTSFALSSKKNLATYFAAELYRFDLSAADMEEARKGIAVVGVTDGKYSLKAVMKYLRLFPKTSEGLQNMHPHRVRKIYSQLPCIFAHLVEPLLNFLPKKLASRVNVVESMEELHAQVMGCKEDISVHEWALQRKKIYEETLEKLSL
jgi:hypothetical protein